VTVPAYDAVVLAGGRATRLGGIDKTALGPAGDTLLDRALRSVEHASRRILVAGPELPAPPGVLRATESPRYGGPVAALAAALRVPGEGEALVVVLAADLPAVERALPAVLAAVDEAAPADGWIGVDPNGRDQPLLAVYRRGPLAAAVDGVPRSGAGAPLRRVLAGLRLIRVPLAVGLAADVDTPADAARAGLDRAGPGTC
jgi:molybdopterin-guanine dinucleotide biosynthesis protein A